MLLEGVSINSLHRLAQIEETHEHKILGHIVKVESNTLVPQDIMFDYQIYWWSSLKFAASIVSFKIREKFYLNCTLPYS